MDFRAKLAGWLKDDAEAVAFVDALFDVAHFWDDLIDMDVSLTPVEINSAMWKAMVTIPENGFFTRHRHSLMPLVKLAIVNWHTANTLEMDDDDRSRHVAFVLRSSYADILTACAFIVGGREWALEVSTEVRREASAEGFEAYVAALRGENRTV